MNTKDPLLLRSEPFARELFDRWGKQANGFAAEAIIGAAVNLLVNAVRQTHSERTAAIDRLDELMAQAKLTLAAHYDSFGRLKGVFPYDQFIEVPRFDLRDVGKR